jgi:hypothetical protein
MKNLAHMLLALIKTQASKYLGEHNIHQFKHVHFFGQKAKF